MLTVQAHLSISDNHISDHSATYDEGLLRGKSYRGGFELWLMFQLSGKDDHHPFLIASWSECLTTSSV
jgi:hypothetical protein